MIINAKIKNSNLKIDYFIEGLGKINVITGKNNSGKSTLLKLLLDPQYTSFEFNFEERINNKIISILTNAIKNNDQIIAQKYNDYFLSNKINEENLNKFLENIYSDYLPFAAFENPNPLKIIANEIFKIPDNALIPAKRSFKSEVNLNIHRNVKLTDQENIINLLFLLKNSPNSKEDSAYYSEIQKHFIEISEGFEFETTINRDNVLFLLFRKGKEFNTADKFGLGLQDTLSIIAMILNPAIEQVLIEEPENHINPSVQKNLLRFFKEIPNKQFFLTTHSSIFLNPIISDKILLTKFVDKIEIVDPTSKIEALYSLGYDSNDNINTALVMLVEGPGDKIILESLLFLIQGDVAKNIKCLPVGGDNMLHFDFSTVKDQLNLCALIDKDPGSENVRKVFIKKCNENNVLVHRLDRYSIENYIPLHIYKEIFKGQIPESLLEIDPNRKVDEQLGFNVKKNLKKISKLLKVEDIKNTDLYDFLFKIQTYYSS